MTLQIGKPSYLKSKGFTFIELILVAIIILVLVGISAPFFRKPFSNIQLKDTCRNLVQLMRYAQAKAIAERRFCRINFNLEKGTFWPTVEAEGSRREFEKIRGRWGRGFKAPDDISIKASDNISSDGEISFVAFYPDGSSDKVEIIISDEKGKTFAITTQRTIRYVELQE